MKCTTIGWLLLGLLIFGLTAPARSGAEDRSRRSRRGGPPPAGENAVSFPQMSREFLAALEALGVRPGMTLAEARAAAATWGARLEREDLSNLSESAKPSPANVYSPDAINRAFEYRSLPEPTYRGHPRSFDPDAPDQSWPAGALDLLVFPIEPLGDLADPTNLVVYYVQTSVMWGSPRTKKEGVMSEVEFLRQGAERVGLELHTAMSGARSDCGFAIPDYVQRIVGLGGVPEPRTPENLPAWKACGTIVLVEPNRTGDNVYGYRVRYGDATLAERALEAFRVFGSEQPRDR
ncbi:MAG: hypothetical protein R3B81_01840 [bacterium]